MQIGLGIGIAVTAGNVAAGRDRIRPAGDPPVLHELIGGDTVQVALSPGALDTASYTSLAGAINGVTGAAQINGTAAALTDTVVPGDTASVTITVTDDGGGSRAFALGPRSVIDGETIIFNGAPVEWQGARIIWTGAN